MAKTPRLPQITPTREDWIRLATWIDGEGCIESRLLPTPCGRLYLRTEVSVYNTDPRVYVWCRERFGGALSLQQPKGWRPKYAWRVSGHLARFILTSCLDLFLIKREQAELALALMDTILKGSERNKGVSKELNEKRMGMIAQMKALKRKDFQPPVIQ